MTDLIEAAATTRSEFHAAIDEIKMKMDNMSEKTKMNTFRINEFVKKLQVLEDMIKNHKSTVQTPFSSPPRAPAGGDLPTCA